MACWSFSSLFALLSLINFSGMGRYFLHTNPPFGISLMSFPAQKAKGLSSFHTRLDLRKMTARLSGSHPAAIILRAKGGTGSWTFGSRVVTEMLPSG